MTEPAPRPSIAAIFFVFLRIGLLSFGGGLTGWVYRDVVLLRHWLDEDEFMSGIAMSQILPGTNITNLAVYIGQKLRGLPGVCAAFLGLLSGPFFAVIALAGGYGAIRALPFAQEAMEGIAAAAIGMLFVVAGRGAQRTSRDIATFAALLATFVSVGLLHFSLLITVAVVGPLSVLAAWLRSPADAR